MTTNVLSGDETTAVLDRQTAVMEQLAAGARLGTVLDAIVGALEALMPSSHCSILLLDDDGLLRHGSAPGLPVGYSDAIDGLAPGPLAGSCGTAVHLDDQVIAVDVTIDRRWEQFRDLAAVHGLRACWSSPIRCRSTVAGTFAVYHSTPWEPDDRDRELVRRFTHLASIAVEHERASNEREARHVAEVARHSAERANHAKSQFVTSLSHELRTPLQAIAGFTENLRTLDLSPDRRREALERIDLGVRHIMSIVDDVLALARVEAGAMPIESTPVELHEVISSSLDLLTPLTGHHRIEVEPTDSSAIVRADRRRLQQVLINLVSNAVRFSPPGCVVRIETGRTERYAAICVVDDGPGIPEDLLARLFVPFDRLGADAGREGGAGLGLVLARRLTEAMSGTLDVDSTVGVGTRITVTLPVASTAP